MTDALPPPRLDLLVHSPTAASLTPVLEQLLEASPVLSSKLAPDLHATFKQSPPKTYSELLDTAATLVAKWDVADQALFLASHPRIGETIGLSSASAKEQQPGQGQQQTPGEVLKRLSVSHSCYSRCCKPTGRVGRTASAFSASRAGQLCHDSEGLPESRNRCLNCIHPYRARLRGLTSYS